MGAVDPVILEMRVEAGRAASDVRNYASDVERSMDRAGRAADRAGTAIAVSSNRAGASLTAMRQAGIGAGQQIQDFAVQVGSGTSAVTAMAQQLPQLAFQLSVLEGSGNRTLNTIGKFSTFLAGPWGAAIAIGGLALSGLISWLDKSGDASDRNAAAVDRFTDALKRLTAASGSISAADLGALDVQQRQLQGQIASKDREIARLKSRPALPDSPDGPTSDALDARIAKLTADRAELVDKLQNVQATLEGSQRAFAKQQERSQNLAADNRVGTTKRAPSSSGKSEEDRAAEKAAAATERQNEAVQGQIVSLKQQIQLQQMRANGLGYQADILEAQWEIEKRFPGASKQLVDLAIELNQELVTQKKNMEDMSRVRLDPKDVDDYISRFIKQNQAVIDSVKKSSSEVDDALKQARERGLDELSYGLADVITGVESLGDVFDRVANEIIAGLLRIAIQRSIIEPLSGLFNDSGGGGGDFFGNVFKGIGGVITGLFGHAGGGYVAPGSISRVNEQNGGVELLRMGPQGGTVIPLGQAQQTLSSPNSGQPGVATVQLMLSDDIDARIVNVSGPVAVEVVRSAAPDIVNAASNETLRRAGRRTM